VFSYNSPGIYGVSLSVENSFGCIDTTFYNNIIEVYDYPNANFYYSPSEPSLLSSYIEFYNTSTNDPSQFNWNIENLYSSNQENISFEFPTDSLVNYDICLLVSTVNGCSDSICKTIVLKDDFLIYTPNAFSPDGDGVNDDFYPIINGFSEQSYKLYVFNRWGELVFDSYYIQNKWNGKDLNGKECKEGVFVWKLIVQDTINTSDKIYYGNVTLLR
jgi:gliding motility-associated-like protein